MRRKNTADTKQWAVICMFCAVYAFGSLAPSDAFAAEDGLPHYTIHRAQTPIKIDGKGDEEAWKNTAAITEFVFPWWKEGEREKTTAKLLYDDDNLYVLFGAEDKHISAEHKGRDEAVSNDDCVEVFVAPNPEEVEKYFNFEFNALGTILDGSYAADGAEGWNEEGIRVAIEIEGTLNDDTDEDTRWTAEIAIPFRAFNGVTDGSVPQPGATWRLNLYRCGGKVNAQYAAWSDTKTAHPDYHVPPRFGVVTFGE